MISSWFWKQNSVFRDRVSMKSYVYNPVFRKRGPHLMKTPFVQPILRWGLSIRESIYPIYSSLFFFHSYILDSLPCINVLSSRCQNIIFITTTSPLTKIPWKGELYLLSTSWRARRCPWKNRNENQKIFSTF